MLCTRGKEGLLVDNIVKKKQGLYLTSHKSIRIGGKWELNSKALFIKKKLMLNYFKAGILFSVSPSSVEGWCIFKSKPGRLSGEIIERIYWLMEDNESIEEIRLYTETCNSKSMFDNISLLNRILKRCYLNL